MNNLHRIAIRISVLSLLIALGFSASAQLKIKPAIIDVGDGYYNNSFVLVIKANEKSNKPERVIMSDFKADTEAFDPYKLDSYPKWQLSNFKLYNRDGTSTRYVSLRCVTTGQYLKYRSAYGASMVDAKEFDEIMKRDEQRNFVHSTAEMMEFFKEPQIKEGGYIQLGIYNQENNNMVVTPSGWNTREFRLVYVK